MKIIARQVSIGLLAVVVTSCQTRDRGRLAVPVDATSSRVYWRDMAAYKERASHLLLSSDDAWRRLQNVRVHKPMFGLYLVDDWYVFNLSTNKEPDLTGSYVHAMNGTVEYREAVYDHLKYPGQPKGLRYVRMEKLAGPEKPTIYWLPSKACQSKIDELPLLPVDATDRLRDFGVQAPPLRGVVNDWYFFADSSEPVGSLTGYYVQGTTGIIQRRTAQTRVPAKQSRLETLNYVKIDTLSGPLLPRVYWVGSKAYKTRLRAREKREQQARETLASIGAGPSTLRAYIDGYFLFSPPGEKSLSGYYVSGSSGIVEHRVARHHPLEYPKHPKNLRFENVKRLDPGRPDEDR